ncbi:hypothetical protein CBO05C_3248 [Clostridium botulinum B str. Osaka05]|uniref:Uncharacterized protein n=1 Tax=Clostridium botulinum B str. Osaka05 TaxID=1407017 RepID=A0A0S6U5I4_CLOBO|nr:hypothetical protein CBO05C_3248 [Clostridium botulinum B str. Osaka05]
MMRPLANIIKKIGNSVVFNSIIYFIILFSILMISITFAKECSYVYSQF